MPSATVYVSLVLLFNLTSVEAKCGKQCYSFLGEKIEIPCGITGTYAWPQWTKGNVLINNEGHSRINPNYAARYSIDTDNRTLIINNAEKSDAGRYQCHHPNGPNSPEAVEVLVEEPFNACVIKNISKPFVLLLIVVIVMQCDTLIRTYQECKQNENKQEDKLKEKIKSMSICNVHTVFSTLILVIAVFIIVSVWLTLKPEEDCEKLTKMKHSVCVSLLVVEIIVFVLGVINGLVYNYFVRKRKTARGYRAQYAKRTSKNHVTGGDTVSIKDNAEVAITEQLVKELEKEGSVND